MLSNQSRLMILCQLVDGEKSVGELAHFTGKRETAVSQQLAQMRRQRIVTPRRDGKSIYYRLDRDDLRALISFLYETYCGDHKPLLRKDQNYGRPEASQNRPKNS
ncbi:MAG: ArsR/SmtB family transcription factor [Rhizobiaceae bacterium]